MSATVPAHDAPLGEPIGTEPALASRIDTELGSFLDDRLRSLLDLHVDLTPLAELARAAVLDGGKRLRPTFSYWGWRSVQPAGAQGEDGLIRAAASLELLHACALVHDDLIDASDTRRGRPAAHVRFADYRAADWAGSTSSFGLAGAVLLGDLLLTWSEELFQAGIGLLPPERAGAAREQFDLMRTEVVAGQFLDVLAQTRGAFDRDEALRVIELKTSRYTVQRPLLLGAAAAGADRQLLDRLAGYGHALGEAFQLRDDLLGVFGDPRITGKPAGDDLREGKRTLLLALATEAADPGQLAELQNGIGRPRLTEAEVTRLRATLHATGAPQLVEQRIAAGAEQARDCLAGADLRPEARQVLLELVDIATQRNS